MTPWMGEKSVIYERERERGAIRLFISKHPPSLFLVTRNASVTIFKKEKQCSVMLANVVKGYRRQLKKILEELILFTGNQHY